MMQRHKGSNRCPVCGGADGDPRGKEKRCFGFTSEDGWIHCSREELAGSIEKGPDDCYAHRPAGPCKCGQSHGEVASVTQLRREIVATYDYRDERGALLYQVVRFAPKEFRQRRPDGAGGWLWKLESTRRVLYRLPELVGVDPTKTVYVVEGEKDVDALRERGYFATCNPGGAGKWSAVADLAANLLAGRPVVVVADADDVGRKHAAEASASLGGARVVECPRPHKDVSELLAAGGTLEQLTEGDRPAPPIPWMGTKDIFAPLPEYPWLIPGLHIAPGRVTLLNGYADVGKTVVAMSIALAVASGKSVWGVFAPAKKGPVLHMNGEIGSYLARERYQRLARGMGIDPEELIDDSLRLAQYPAVRLDDEDFEAKLTEACRGCALVVIDSLRAFSGALNENDKEIGIALLMLGRVSEATGATILLLHHNRKAQKDQMGGAKQAISGSSSILGGAECAFVMESVAKGGMILVKQERSPLGRYLDDFGLVIEDVATNEVPRWGLRVTHIEPEQMIEREKAAKTTQESAERLKAHEAIRKTLNAFAGVFRGSKKAFRSACGIGYEPFERALAEMLSRGEMHNVGTYHQPEWHIGSAPSAPIGTMGAQCE